MNEDLRYLKFILNLLAACCGVIVLIAFTLVLHYNPHLLNAKKNTDQQLAEMPSGKMEPVVEDIWHAPDSLDVPSSPEGDLIRYGRELVSHTAVYLGPRGKVKRISNGMNCQNCHLKAGTIPFGNSYAAVNSTYPKFRARSGSIESVEKRVNDCLERSLNGRKLDDESREMKAFVAYIKWVGKDVPKKVTPKGSGIWDLPPINRAADPSKGLIVYKQYCERCHGKNAKGVRYADDVEWKYPPLHGDSSYNIGAGLLRLSRFAGYVKANMPFGVSFKNPVLTDEEAWDVAAYVNSLPRPSKDLSKDWPDISKKPFDHPFGPYADQFPPEQHKYGPFQPITLAQKKN
jgi:thiosulfate dehydrogenase